MLFEAHRGVSTEFPENTLPAFVAAKEQGYHMIELDPRVTADGQWVVHHDSKVGRTCRLPNGERVAEEPIPLEQVSYAQLALYDAGLWKGEQFRGTKVPLLKEVLDFARQADMELKLDNVFAKAPQEQQNKLFDEVEASGAKVGFTCANEETIASVVARFPNAPIHYDGPVSEETLPRITAFLKNNPLTVWIPLECKRTSWCTMPKATPELCAMAKRYARLGIWILHEPEELEQAIALGADIIETTGSLKPQ